MRFCIHRSLFNLALKGGFLVAGTGFSGRCRCGVGPSLHQPRSQGLFPGLGEKALETRLSLHSKRSCAFLGKGKPRNPSRTASERVLAPRKMGRAEHTGTTQERFLPRLSGTEWRPPFRGSPLVDVPLY